MKVDIGIIGAGILGASLAYLLSIFTKSKIVVIEQEANAAYHSSSRNSGKVHAPFLYDPVKKRLVAKIAYLGFDMWKSYSTLKGIPFKIDGVLEVAVDDDDIDRLEQYLEWGEKNGLSGELVMLDDISRLEPEVRCRRALYCKRDASTDYKALTLALVDDAIDNGVRFRFNDRVRSIKGNMIECNDRLDVGFLINAAGGASLDIAHKMGVAKDLSSLYFRGEYWRADDIYNGLTRCSIYSVPKFIEYPFLDPHWLIKVDGRCEVGPNAVPVLDPYGYDIEANLRSLPRLIDMLRESRKVILDREFIRLASVEWLSSLSKKRMIERVRRFLPKIKAEYFKERGIAGVRSIVVDKHANLLSEPLIRMGDTSLHILNYNSPGATGALPFAVHICMMLEREGVIRIDNIMNRYWDLSSIIDTLADENNTII